jgi:crossover junction endodeoxyribonuclease RuvC
MTTILGIDPGSRTTGYGVIRLEGKRPVYVECGCLQVADDELPERLRRIFAGISDVVASFRPDQVAIEKVFVNRNVESALKLGQARGAAIVACANQGLPVHEYSPNQIKLAIVGRGHAEKTQVQHMVKMLLALGEVPPSDAADALAIAMCHAHMQQGLSAIPGVRAVRGGRLV